MKAIGGQRVILIHLIAVEGYLARFCRKFEEEGLPAPTQKNSKKGQSLSSVHGLMVLIHGAAKVLQGQRNS